MDHLTHEVLAFIRTHPELAALVVGGTAFAESFAVVSFFVPGFTILVAAGALAQAGVINPWGALIAGCIGAILGDAISFWIGQRFGHALPRIWPFSRHPQGLESAVQFFKKWGWPSVFIGRFLGPLRAFVPLAAGMCRMPVVPFYAANIFSAVIWAPALLYSGYLVGTILRNGWTMEEKVIAFLAGGLVVVGVLYASRKLFKTE